MYGDGLPSVFAKKAVPFWAGGFVATSLLIMIYGHVLSPESHERATSFLSTNIEILVTMLTVTMGVTLLGLQFRAQSYTMMALILYVKDRIIYGFIIVFVTLIIYNMAALSIHEIDPRDAVPFAFVGTSFSLFYLVGYVYYMVHQIQPVQMMNHIQIRMKKLVADDIIRQESAHEKTELFHVWEQIMLKAVDTDNLYVFRRGTDIVYEVLNVRLNECNDDQKDNVYGFFFSYILTVMLSCVRQDRDRFVRIFMDRFKETVEPVPEQSDGFSSRRMMMFHMWQHIMRESIAHGNFRVSNYGMSSMSYLLQKYLKVYPKHMKKTMLFFHMYVSRVVDFAITNNYSPYMLQYLDIIEKHRFSEDRIADEHTPLCAWTAIMNNAVDRGDTKVFERGMKSIFTMILSPERNIKSTESTHDALLSVMSRCGSESRYVIIFMEHYARVHNDLRPTAILKHIVLQAVHSTDSIIFDICMSVIRNIMHVEDVEFFDVLSGKIRLCMDARKGISDKLMEDFIAHLDMSFQAGMKEP